MLSSGDATDAELVVPDSERDGRALRLPCVTTAFVAKTLPFLAVLRA